MSKSQEGMPGLSESELQRIRNRALADCRLVKVIADMAAPDDPLRESIMRLYEWGIRLGLSGPKLEREAVRWHEEFQRLVGIARRRVM